MFNSLFVGVAQLVHLDCEVCHQVRWDHYLVDWIGLGKLPILNRMPSYIARVSPQLYLGIIIRKLVPEFTHHAIQA